MEDDFIKKRNSNNKVNDKSNLKDYNDNTSINPELNKPIITPMNNYILNGGLHQNNRDLIEPKQKQISNFNNLDAKIKHKKLREGD